MTTPPPIVNSELLAGETLHSADKILAIDTTGAYGSVALVAGTRLIEEVPLHAPDGFAQLLFGEIEALLARHETRFTDIACYAAAAGPGSFTGVRVGLTAVKGLAEASSRQVIAVSNLEALAWYGRGRLRAPVMDARRGEVFAAVYEAGRGGLRLILPEVAMPFDEWMARVTAELPQIAEQAPGGFEPGTLTSPVAELITAPRPIQPGASAPADRWPPEVPEHWTVTEAPLTLAAAVASIAADRYPMGLAQDPAGIDANYVRRSDAGMQWKDLGPRGNALE